MLIFFGNLVNETFSNLKFNVFIITGSIFNNKYVKQVVYKREGDWSSVYSSKYGEGTFFSKKRKGWQNSGVMKAAEGEKFTFRFSSLFINPRNITIQGICIKVTSINIYPIFWDMILSKIQISEIIGHC